MSYALLLLQVTNTQSDAGIYKWAPKLSPCRRKVKKQQQEEQDGWHAHSDLPLDLQFFCVVLQYPSPIFLSVTTHLSLHVPNRRLLCILA